MFHHVLREACAANSRATRRLQHSASARRSKHAEHVRRERRVRRSTMRRARPSTCRFVYLALLSSEAKRARLPSTRIDAQSAIGVYDVRCRRTSPTIPGCSVRLLALGGDAARHFGEHHRSAEFAEPRQGLTTADNERFLRLWWEVQRRSRAWTSRLPMLLPIRRTVVPVSTRAASSAGGTGITSTWSTGRTTARDTDFDHANATVRASGTLTTSAKRPSWAYIRPALPSRSVIRRVRA